MSRILTLTTDFGTSDHYVAVLKAVVLDRAPSDTRLLDITHDIPPGDVLSGGWVLGEASRWYPEGSIHLAVVDPGVGTDRKGVLVECRGMWFVGPDNGLLSVVCRGAEYQAWVLDREEWWIHPVSSTFHGRDIFAPVAAHLAGGVPPDKLGSGGHRLLERRWIEPEEDADSVHGWIIHCDRFGNLVSNIPMETLVRRGFAAGGDGLPVRIYIENTILSAVHDTFGHVEEGEVVAYGGSSGMLEIGVNRGSAAQILGARTGTRITVLSRA